MLANAAVHGESKLNMPMSAATAPRRASSSLAIRDSLFIFTRLAPAEMKITIADAVWTGQLFRSECRKSMSLAER
jgi:hypothetical protein